ADVCIVGAGFTGLWTAYHLRRADPTLRVAVVERETAGFGASGRNGGWCSALFPVQSMAPAMRAALSATIDDIDAACHAEGIDCDLAKAGSLELATTAAQLTRLRAALPAAPAAAITGPSAPAGESAPTGESAPRWLDADQAARLIRVPGALGGILDPQCAALHPLKLVRGLAAAVQHHGAELFEHSPAQRIEPGRVVLADGEIQASAIVRATEGYTAALPGLRRDLVPLYSLIIATEPLPESVWAEIGWNRRVTLSDGRRLVVHAQRSADGRIVLGGRGAPYHFGSRTSPAFDSSPAVFEHLRRTLATLFPAAANARITHRWGGPLGVPRGWTPGVSFDPDTGLAWAGGYIGDGVTAAALAGRTLADLIRGHRSPRTELPWVVNHRRPWEPEPARWLGINAGRLLAAATDARENRTGRP
uniref:NAD(P)/FAD-dependent oxidoreductase n=1 Tax=Frankia tisae TaxID=2950104 RepID=UPI0021BF0FF5